MKKELSIPTLASFNPPNAAIGYLRPNELFSDSTVEELGIQLILWAETDKNALKLSQFATIKRIAFSTLFSFVERNENFARCYEEAKRIIGDRREILMLTNRMNQSGMAQMVKYDDSFRKVEEWRAKLRRKIEELDAAKKIIVQLQNYQVPEGFKLVKADSIPDTLKLIETNECANGFKLEPVPVSTVRESGTVEAETLESEIAGSRLLSSREYE